MGRARAVGVPYLKGQRPILGMHQPIHSTECPAFWQHICCAGPPLLLRCRQLSRWWSATWLPWTCRPSSPLMQLSCRCGRHVCSATGAPSGPAVRFRWRIPVSRQVRPCFNATCHPHNCLSNLQGSAASYEWDELADLVSEPPGAAARSCTAITLIVWLLRTRAGHQRFCVAAQPSLSIGVVVIHPPN